MYQYIQRKLGAKQNANTTLDKPLKVAEKKIISRAQLTGQPASAVAALITANPNTLAQYTKYLRENRVPITDASPEALARAVYAQMQKEYLQAAQNVIQSNPELHSAAEVNNPMEVAKQIAYTAYDLDAAEYDHCQKNNMLGFTNCLSPAGIVAADLIGITQPDNYDSDCNCGDCKGCEKKKFDYVDPPGSYRDPNMGAGYIDANGVWHPDSATGTNKSETVITGGGTLVKEWRGYQIYSDGTITKNGAEINIWEEFTMSDLCAIGDMVDIKKKLGDNAKYYSIACGVASAWDAIKGPVGDAIQWMLGNTTNLDKNWDNMEGYLAPNIDVNQLGRLTREWRVYATGSESGTDTVQNPIDISPLNITIYGENVVKGNWIVNTKDDKLFGNIANAEREIHRAALLVSSEPWKIPAFAKFRSFACIPLAAQNIYNEDYLGVRQKIKNALPSWNSVYSDNNYNTEKLPENQKKINEIFKNNWGKAIMEKAKEQTGTGTGTGTMPPPNNKPCEGNILWVGGQDNLTATGMFTDFAAIGGNLAAGDLVDIAILAGADIYTGRRKVKYIGDDAGGNKWNMFTIDFPIFRSGGVTVASQGKFKKVITGNNGGGGGGGNGTGDGSGTGGGNGTGDGGKKKTFRELIIAFFGWDKKGLFN
jgi:hypothetical protein